MNKYTQELHNLAIEASGIGMWVWKTTDNSIIWNDRMYDLLDFPKEDGIPSLISIKNRIHPDDICIFEVFENGNTLNENDNFKNMYRIYDSNYEIKYLNIVGKVFIEDENKVYAGICYDRTKEKELELSKIEQENNTDRILDSIPAFVFYKDKQNNFIKMNQTLLDFIGNEKEQIENRNLSDIYGQELAKKYYADDLEIFETGKEKSHIIESTINWKGETRWFDTTKVPYFNSNNEIEGVIGFSIDITDKLAIENQLKESEIIYRTLVDNASEPIMLVDDDHNIILMNDISKHLFGEEIAKKDISQLAANKITHDIFVECEIQKDKYFKEEVVLKTISDGQMHFSMSYCPVKINSHFRGGIFILYDISEMIEKERIIRNFNRKLQQKNKELEDFTYIVSHDLKAPLRQIKMFSDLSNSLFKKKEYDKCEKNLSKIIDVCDRMQNLIEDLLELSRISTNKNKYIINKVSDIVSEVKENMEFDITYQNAKINMINDIDLLSDRTQMIQLFQNLISNSIKFKKDNEELKIDIECDSNQIIYSDNGIGFDNKYKEKIFEIFERLYSKEKYEGTGIGLTICKKICEEHGWIISADGQTNKGATFMILLGDSNE